MRRFLVALVAVFFSFNPLSVFAANTASADIINVGGEVIGKATLQQGPTGVLINVEVQGLSPGAHAIHMHGVGSCKPDFKAATGHINPGKSQHGLLNPDGPDSGDLPNLYVAADGSVKAAFFTARVSLEGGSAPLLDEDGSAFIIHENRDDHMAQPIGGAGGRVACGVIKAM